MVSTCASAMVCSMGMDACSTSTCEVVWSFPCKASTTTSAAAHTIRIRSISARLIFMSFTPQQSIALTSYEPYPVSIPFVALFSILCYAVKRLFQEV